jgi:hypothetical protein
MALTLHKSLHDMKRKNLSILLIVILVAGVGAFGIYKYMNKPHRTSENEKPVATLTASALFNEYEADEQKSNALYLDKTIQVSGTIQEQTTEPSGNVVALLTTESMMGTVSCTFTPVDGKPQTIPADGQSITLKGICKGYNSIDVIIEQCTLIQ